MLKGLLETAASVVFPVECEICAVLLPPSHASGVCSKCASGIRTIDAPHCVSCGRTLKYGPDPARCHDCGEEIFHFDRAFACTFYDGNMKQLLHAFKFDNRKILKSYFAELLTRFIRQHLDTKDFDLLAAVPMDREKKNKRGFNQSEILCSAVAGQLKMPESSHALGRISSRFTQSLLKKSERKSNVRGCFRVKARDVFSGKRVLLVDDILTTGQTASECARALKEAGASSVTVLALARGA